MYNLPTTVDPNKVFLIKRSELEGRFDPKYIEPVRLEFYIKLRKSKNVVRLKEVIKEGSYGILPPGDSYDENLPIKFIRATELKEDLRIDFENVFFVERKYYTKRAAIKQHDILLAVKGATIAGNKCVSFVSENVGECIVNGSIFRMQINEKANPLYVAYLLNSDLLKRQMKFNLVANNAVDYLDKSLIYNLLIPLPSNEEQEKIVNLFQNAYTAKQQKEAEAKALLASIDTYLLSELGISLEEKNQTFYFQEPEPRYGIHYKIQKDYKLNEASKLVQEGKIFLTNFSEVTGGRYDPKLYDNNTKGLKRAIENNRFKSELLKNLITQSAAGDWGKDENEVLGNDFIKCLVIRATEFDNQYNLRLDNSRVKYRWIHKDKLARIDINENDLLIEKSGGSPDQPVGRIAIIKKNMVEKNQLCYSNFIHKIRVDSSKVNPKYLFYLLKTFHNIKLTDSMQSQTNGIRNLIMREYFNQTIPLPFAEDSEKSLKKQSEIANHIQNIRSQAKALQHEAASVLEDAKREVEKMILGE